MYIIFQRTKMEYRRKVKCAKCNKEKFCYNVEIQIVVFKENTLAVKVEDWCCLDCISKLMNEISSFKRKSMSPEEWLKGMEAK